MALVGTVPAVSRFGGAGIGVTKAQARLDYVRARRLLIVVGIAVLGVLVALLLVRSVDEVEVVATLLFVPIFLALMFFGMVGGVATAVASTVLYVVLRADVIDAVGWSEYSGLIGTRALSYVLFGAVGGWASTILEQSLDKLDLYDQIDDQTGVHNARFLLSDVDLERSRCIRYQTVFSVSFLQFPTAALATLPARRRRSVLRELGVRLRSGVRTVDRVAHGSDGRVHHVAAMLPETGSQGAEIFHGRFVTSIREFLVANDLDPDVVVSGETCTIPGDESALEARLVTWDAIDAAEHSTARR